MNNRKSSHHQHCVATALNEFIRLSGHPALAFAESVVLLVVVAIALHFVIPVIPLMPHEVHASAAFLDLTARFLKRQLNHCNH